MKHIFTQNFQEVKILLFLDSKNTLGNKFSQMKRSKTNNHIQGKEYYKSNFDRSKGFSKHGSSTEDLSPVPSTITIRKKVKTAGDSSLKNPFNTTFGPLNSIGRVQSSDRADQGSLVMNFEAQNPFDSSCEYNFTPTLPNMDNYENGVDDEPQPLHNPPKRTKKIRRNAFEDKIFQVKHPKQMSTASKRKRGKKLRDNALFTNDKNFRNIEMTLNNEKKEDIM